MAFKSDAAFPLVIFSQFVANGNKFSHNPGHKPGFASSGCFKKGGRSSNRLFSRLPPRVSCQRRWRGLKIIDFYTTSLTSVLEPSLMRRQAATRERGWQVACSTCRRYIILCSTNPLLTFRVLVAEPALNFHFYYSQTLLRELEFKKPQLDELVNTAETLKSDANRLQLQTKGEFDRARFKVDDISTRWRI